MRIFVGLCLLVPCLAFAAPEAAPDVPAPLAAALANFRAEGPKGWSFTQTTEGDGRSRVERYDAAQPDFARWTLVQQDGRAPTTEETRDYQEKLSRRSRGGTPPRLVDQLDLLHVAIVNEAPDRIAYRARLQPGEAGDKTAEFLFATMVVHTPTQTVESFEIAAMEPFSPVWGVNIAEMKTTMLYSLPSGDRPSLLQKTVTRVRGRAFFFKSLDADLVVTFAEYQKAGRAAH